MIEEQDYVLTTMEVHSLKPDDILTMILFNCFIITFLGYTYFYYYAIIINV